MEKIKPEARRPEGSSATAGSTPDHVVITAENEAGEDELYCEWYFCPKCGDEYCMKLFNYCPICGVKIKFE